jgi:hypothetical protein
MKWKVLPREPDVRKVREALNLAVERHKLAAIPGNVSMYSEEDNVRGGFFERNEFHVLVSFCRGRFGIPSPATKSKYAPAPSVCKLRNKCRLCVRRLLARSGFYLLRAQKNRWTYRTSTGFSPLPAAGQTLSWRSRFSAAWRGVVGGVSALSLEIRRSRGTFLLVREVSDLQLNFFNVSGCFELLFFQLTFQKVGWIGGIAGWKDQGFDLVRDSRSSSYRATLTLTCPFVQQHWNPPPPSPE